MRSASKNGAGRGPYVPKREGSGQEGVRTSKKGRFQARKGRRVQIEQGQVQRRTVPGKKGSASPKTGQEGVGASEKGRFRQEGVGASKIEQGEVGASQNGAGSGRRVQKRGRKRSVHPKRDD